MTGEVTMDRTGIRKEHRRDKNVPPNQELLINIEELRLVGEFEEEGSNRGSTTKGCIGEKSILDQSAPEYTRRQREPTQYGSMRRRS
jgi:hypothetical protein